MSKVILYSNITVILVNLVFPCDCAPPPSPEDAYNMADVVFSGEVTNIIEDWNNLFKEVSIDVYDVWKGSIDNQIIILTGIDDGICGYNFQINEEYLIYGNYSNNDIWTNICTRTNLLVNSEEDLDYLNTFIDIQCDGDANLDEEINILDIISTVNHILGNEYLIDQSFENADNNNDNVIDILDVILIVSIVLEGITDCDTSLIPIDLSLEWEFQEDLSYFDSETLQEIMDIEISALDLIRGMIVIHNGKIVSEEYYNGSFENDIYNIFSVTKSYVSTLIGQAIDQDLIDNQYSTLDSFFPEYDIEYPQYVQLDDLLSMSSGYLDDYGEWPDYWYDATTEELLGMNHLDGPGTFFYNNSACHIHSHILYNETGLTPKEFANINLFPYLGINNPDWNSGNSEISNGSAGLMLNLREMVKLGQLYLQDGYSADTQVLSSEWVQEATSTQMETSWNWNGNGGYGYLWWLPDRGYLAWGLGGQFIVVIPELNLVVGTHSSLSDVETNYQILLAGVIYNQIVPLFE